MGGWGPRDGNGSGGRRDERKAREDGRDDIGKIPDRMDYDMESRRFRLVM